MAAEIAIANEAIAMTQLQHPSSTNKILSDGPYPAENEWEGGETTRAAAAEAEAEEASTAKPRPPPIDTTAAQNASPGQISPTSATPRTPKPAHERERKIGHRRVDDDGQITYKKIQTSQIMGSIQLGIGHSVGKLASKPERDLLIPDFALIETHVFPKDGSSSTPAHHYAEFKFKNYAPVAFRYFRELFGIQPDDFLLSICNFPLIELTNPGASGSIFYLTGDDEFIIKTVQHKEGEFLQKLLPGYYMNLNQNPRTLLPKFFGLYCFQCGGKNVRLVVMNNLLPFDIKMHQKYDLKGSTYKRKAAKGERSKASPTFKDLDFVEHHPEGLLLEVETYNALIKTIQRDCRVLESFKIMDYSLLVGIHNLDQAAMEKRESRKDLKAKHVEERLNHGVSEDVEIDEAAGFASGARLSRSKSMNRQRLVAHTGLEAIQAESEPIDEQENMPPGGIPARNAKGERLMLYIGIIDILQSYRLKKKLEHTWKAMLHDGDSVSVHRPGFYSQRFQDFMAKKVFNKIPSLDMPEFKGPHRRFRALVSSYIALKHSPSRKKSLSMRHRPPSMGEDGHVDEREVIVLARETTEGGPHASSPLSPSNNVISPAASSPCSSAAAAASSSLVGLTSPASLPAVLKARPLTGGVVVRPKVPPPVPPRSPRWKPANTGVVSSTPPPSFEEAVRDDKDSTTKSDSGTGSELTPHLSGAQDRSAPLCVADSSDVISISHVTIKAESTLSTQSIVSESSSTTSSGFSSAVRTSTWTPPRSVEGSTPTHTEGTPSFTESSSSGDLGCPTTPVRTVLPTMLASSKEPTNRNGIGITQREKSYKETEMTRL